MTMIQVFHNVPNHDLKEHSDKHHWTELANSKASSSAPISMGVWKCDAGNKPSEIFEAEVDEVKYIISGEITVRDCISNTLHTASPESVVWIPKGSKSQIVSSTGAVAFYAEQVPFTGGPIKPKPVTESQMLQNDGATLEGDKISRAEAASLSTVIEKKLKSTLDAFTSTNIKSRETHERAESVLPGGNTRSALAYLPFPLVLDSGRECFVTSVDGTEYLDFVSEYSAGIYGHSNPDLKKAVIDALEHGTNLGGLTEKEAVFGKLIQRRFPNMELMRFCNSGTEANLMAIATAKVHTKRQKILVFENGYHGGILSFHGHGSPINAPHEFVIAPYNNIEVTANLISQEIAAVLVEPVLGAGGCIPGTPEFLQFLRDRTREVGALLIFDEVMTSRLAFKGMQGFHDIVPDLTTLGKYLGGGFAFGAFGGRRDIMARFGLGKAGPTGETMLAHSGTFNNNTFTMSAGIAGARLLTPAVFDDLTRLGDTLRNGINELAGRNDIAACFYATGFGSLIGTHFRGLHQSALLEIFFFYLLERGLYIGKRGFFSLNIAHSAGHIEKALAVISGFISEFKQFF